MRLVALVTLFAGAAGAQTSPLLHRQAPRLTGNAWLNVSPGAKLSLEDRRGKVTVVHFWTFACINCRNNLPAYARWHKRFSERDVLLIGVHTPELEHEKDFQNVAEQTKVLGIDYPVLFDPNYENWHRWKQQFWPAIYVVDRKGVVRAVWFGELNYGNRKGEVEMASAIERLLAE